MLLNLSNIPVSGWSKKQISTAEKEFGEITELPFPQIYPEWETSDITKLAIEYSEKF